MASSGPSFAPGAPSCPDWLNRSAKAVWRRVLADLEDADAVAIVDADLLASYCTAVSDLKAVSQAIDKDGVTIDVPTFNRNGEPTGHTHQKPNPLLRTKDALLGRVKQLADALGIGPAARTRQGSIAESSPRVNPVIAIRDRIAAHRAAADAKPAGGQ